MPPPLPGRDPPPWATAEAAAHQQKMEGDRHWVTPELSGAIRAHYYGKISHIDWWIGRISEAFRKRGMWEHTSVVFWSDHGDMLCDKGRIHKSVFYEGASRVPLIIRPAPGTLPCRRGAVCHSLVSLVDCVPTIADLAGCSPSRYGYGKPLTPLLTNPDTGLHDAVFSEIDRRTMIRTEEFKMVMDMHGTVLKLYDMRNDPTESVNLVGRDDMSRTVAELRDRLLLWHLGTPNRLDTYDRLPPG